MAGLFDTSNDTLSQIMAQRQRANQALGSPYGRYSGIVQSAGGMVDTMMDAAAGGGAGASDPAMQKQKELKQIAQVIAQQMGGQTNTPDYFKALAVAVQDKYPDKAEEALAKAAKMEQEQRQAKLTGLQTQQAELGIQKTQAELAATKTKAEKEAAALSNRVKALKTFMPKEDSDVLEAFASSSDVFNTIVKNMTSKTEPKLDTSNMGAAMRAASNSLYGVDFAALKDPAQRQEAAKKAMDFLDKKTEPKTDTPKQSKPTATILNKYSDSNKNAMFGKQGIEQVDGYIDLIEKDAVKYGNIENLRSEWRALLGKSTESDREKANIRRFVTGAVNAVLNMAKGPQTEGDAVRAKEQILNGLDKNDPMLVKDGLNSLKRTLNSSLAADIDSMSIYEEQYPSLGNRSTKFNKQTEKKTQETLSADDLVQKYLGKK